MRERFDFGSLNPVPFPFLTPVTLKRLWKNTAIKSLMFFRVDGSGFAETLSKPTRRVGPRWLRPFCVLASLRLSHGVRPTPSPRLSSKQNVGQFSVTGFLNSLLRPNFGKSRMHW